MHESHIPLPDQSRQARRVAPRRPDHRGQSGRRGQRTPQHAERPHQHLDPVGLEIVRQLAARRQHNDRLVAVAVEAAGDQPQLAIRAVASARGVDEQDRAGRYDLELHREDRGRRLREQLGMNDVGKQLEAVDEARTRPREVRGGVDGDDLDRAQCA